MRNNIKSLLESAGKTVAEAIEESGIGRTSFYAIMNGDQIPKIDTAARISKAIGFPLQKVFPDLKEVV